MFAAEVLAAREKGRGEKLSLAEAQKHRYYLTFVVAGVAIAIIILGVAGSLLSTIDHQLREDAKMQVRVLTDQAASNADDHIHMTEHAIASFSIESSDLDKIQPSLKALKESFEFDEVAFINLKGEGCCASGTPYSKKNISGTAVSKVENGLTYCFPHLNEEGEYVYQVNKAIFFDGVQVGTLYVDVPIDMLINKKQFSVFDGQGYFILFGSGSGMIYMLPTELGQAHSFNKGDSLFGFLDETKDQETGRTVIEASEDLFSNPDEVADQTNVELLKKAVDEGSSAIVTVSIDGESNYLCVSPVGDGGYYVCSVIPESNLRTEAPSINTAFVVVFGIILVCLIAVLVMFSFLYRKRAGERGLEMKTHLYGALSDSLDMAVNMYSPDDGIVTPIVAKTREILGYSMAEFMGNKRIVDRIAISDHGKKMLKRLHDGDIVTMERGEFSFKSRRNNELRWVSYSINPFYYDKKRQLLVVFQDSTRAKNLELSMKDAMVAAETANHAKSDFLSRMSHEIRTPMNAIIGMTQIAEKHLDDPERVKASLKKIGMASDHLLTLINDVLDISKIESGKMLLMCEDFNLAEVIENVQLVIGSQCEQKQQTFEVIRGTILEEEFVGDRMRLQQVLINLLSNSVKYTPAEGKISLSIDQKPSPVKSYVETTFVIKDNGIGMTEEYQEHLFEPFVMEGRTMSQGTGLGMPIVKNILTMMNGDIQVESVVNEGTAFTVIVNLECRNYGEGDEEESSEETAVESKVAEEKDDEKTPDEGNMTKGEIDQKGDADLNERITDQAAQTVDRLSEGIVANRSEGVSGLEISLVEKDSSSDKQSNFDFSNIRVLLAEDNELNAEIAQELLSDAGISVEWAHDGEDVCAKFEESEPGYYDLILMDIQMPFLNGYEATSCIRNFEREDAKDIPIIAMSANAFMEDIQASLRSGMNAHLSKPIDIRLVLDSIAEQIRKRS